MKTKSLSLILFLVCLKNIFATEEIFLQQEGPFTTSFPLRNDGEPLTELKLNVLATASELLQKNVALKKQLTDLSLTPYKIKLGTLSSFTLEAVFTKGTDFVSDIFATLKSNVFAILSSIISENAELETQLAKATSGTRTPSPAVQESPAAITFPVLSPSIDSDELDKRISWKDLKSMTMQVANKLLFQNTELKKQFHDRPVPVFEKRHTFLPFTTHDDSKCEESFFVSQILSTLKENVIGFLSDLIEENRELQNQLANEQNTTKTLQNEKDQESTEVVDSLGDAEKMPLRTALKEATAEEEEKDAQKAAAAVSSATPPKLIKLQSRRSSSQRLISTGNVRFDNFVRELKWQGSDLETLEPLIKAKLKEITGPQFTLTALENSLLKLLNEASTLEQATMHLRSQTNSPTVLRSTTDSRRKVMERHDSDLAQQRVDTAAYEKAQSIAKYTRRFLAEGKIIPGWGDKLNTDDREALDAEIRQVVEDCYDGVIPNFCGKREGPIEDFIRLAATQTSLEKLRAAISKAKTNIQWEKAQQRDAVREANLPQIESTFLNIDHHMMFSTTNTSVMQDIHCPETRKKMKLNKPEHAGIRENFERLVNSPATTGFVCLPLVDQDNYMHLTIKAFWLKGPSSSSVPDQYDPIFLIAHSISKGIIEEFEKLTKGEYLLWLLRLNCERYFFAIPKKSSLTVISLTLNKGDTRLNGYIINRIKCAQKITSEMAF